eukprot:2888122-Prorocentrum_lima.AAC.1
MMCMNDAENKPMWIRAAGSSRRTSPYKVELLLGEDQPYQHVINLEEETPLSALKRHYPARGAEI